MNKTNNELEKNNLNSISSLLLVIILLIISIAFVSRVNTFQNEYTSFINEYESIVIKDYSLMQLTEPNRQPPLHERPHIPDLDLESEPESSTEPVLEDEIFVLIAGALEAIATIMKIICVVTIVATTAISFVLYKVFRWLPKVQKRCRKKIKKRKKWWSKLLQKIVCIFIEIVKWICIIVSVVAIILVVYWTIKCITLFII